ncbi:hypothetical protein M407DRAFT_28766 [Tulasnella calospora MUT 4182]|uniref:Protein kinase domain-containing protein n=1 Tax=Tulasnella calospora MUT 4182 TaxID=1051891 RepID=A0A0C3Q0R5_9AGAM|nr:hypothetical protein M407DRAFT_28766 [Tulasnella calospora MUT 4182]
MAHDTRPGSNENRARDILNGMSHCRIDPSRIKMMDNGPRAKGCRGTVYAGTFLPPETCTALPPELKVAVKMLEWRRDDAEESTKYFKLFVHELSLMETLSHPNVIRLVGFVEDMQKGEAWVIVPWEANGNVREFLQSGEWGIPERVALIKDVVSGLEYLHTREPPICHGDLKSMNILVNSSDRAVICDLGTARTKGNGKATKEEDPSELPLQIPVKVEDVDEASGLTSPKVELDAATLNLTLTGPEYTLRWAAPEALEDHTRDLPSDMWSIGWICWEIITGRIPYGELKDSSVVMHIIQAKLPAIRDDTRLSHVLQLCDLMSVCWLLEPAKRIDVSTFCRKVRFVPSITPSATTPGNEKLRSANLLVELGRMYGLQSNTEVAAFHYQSAHEVAVGEANAMAKANALLSLAEIYNAQSRYSEAEKAYKEAYDIHFCVGNDLGVANICIGLGDIYGAQSKHSEAEQTFKKSQAIYSRIRNDFGTAGTLIDLGDIYDARSRYSGVETAIREAHEIISRIGDGLGATNALIHPGDIKDARSRYSEAEKAFREAHEILSRIGNDLKATNAPTGQGEVYNARLRYQEAEIAYREAYQIHSRISDGLDLGAANALIGLGGIYEAQSMYSESEKAVREAYEIHSRIGNDLGTANAQIGLGKIYNARSRYSEAEEAFREAYRIHSRIGNHLGVANAQIGLGNIYNACSRYSEAEKAFGEACGIHSRISSDLGGANALIGLVGVYNSLSRHLEAEKAFREAHEIHCRIGNDLGTASALIGLGEIHSAWWRYLDAEKAFREAHEIYSRIGNDLGAANALLGLGDIYHAQLKYSEAEQIFTKALEIHSRISNDLGAANALIGLGDISIARSRYTEAETTFAEAQKTYSRIGNVVRAAKAGIRLGETYNTQLKYPEADGAFKEALGILSSVENTLSPENASNNSEEDCETQSSYSGDEGAEGNHPRVGHNAKGASALEDFGDTHMSLSTNSGAQKGLERAREVYSSIGMGTEIEYFQNDSDQWSDTEGSYDSPRERFPAASPPPCTALSPTSLHETGDSLYLPSERMNDDPASSQMAFVAVTPPNSSRQEQDLSEELTAIAHAPTPATEELVDLLQALGKAAPKAVRNKHKISSILRLSRDICTRIMEIGDPHECQSDSNIQTLLIWIEGYCSLLGALEETLLQLTAILPFEVTTFGADLYSSWPSSRSKLAGILNELCRPPFSTISSHAQDIADDLFFDDCSWLSHLLYTGIHPAIDTQFLAVPQTHPVFAVANGLEYLENQVKCGVLDEPTRELIIDIATLLAQTLASTSPDDDDDKSLQETPSLPTEADRDWLVQALADSFSILHLDSTLQPSTAEELAIKWVDVKDDFTLRGRSASGN